jgi:hypothetical protein
MTEELLDSAGQTAVIDTLLIEEARPFERLREGAVLLRERNVHIFQATSHLLKFIRAGTGCQGRRQFVEPLALEGQLLPLRAPELPDLLFYRGKPLDVPLAGEASQ